SIGTDLGFVDIIIEQTAKFDSEAYPDRGAKLIAKTCNPARACFLLHEIALPRMKETTCKKLQEIGAFALAGGCTPKRMRQLVEMIRAARNYRWIGIYKIVNNEFVILTETGDEPPAYPRFPISQGLCGAALESGKPIIVGDVHHDPRYLPTFHTTQSEIIVPMINEHRKILGMLDAESEKANAFGDEDRQFLERAGGLIAHCLH